MSAVKILVVEDDVLISEEIQMVLERAGYTLSATVDSCAGALTSVRIDPPDLIFMDIQISGDCDGIEAAKKLKTLGDYPVIFLTNLHNKETVKRAMEVNPANYLAKPFTPAQLLVSIEHALINFSEKKVAVLETQPRSQATFISLPDIVFIKDSFGNYKKQEISDILYIEADRAYCTIYGCNERFVQSSNMSNVAEKINHPNLIQVSRSHIVNRTKIDGIKGNLLLIDGKEIKIGAQYREGLLQQLNLVR